MSSIRTRSSPSARTRAAFANARDATAAASITSNSTNSTSTTSTVAATATRSEEDRMRGLYDQLVAHNMANINSTTTAAVATRAAVATNASTAAAAAAAAAAPLRRLPKAYGHIRAEETATTAATNSTATTFTNPTTGTAGTGTSTTAAFARAAPPNLGIFPAASRGRRHRSEMDMLFFDSDDDDYSYFSGSRTNASGGGGGDRTHAAVGRHDDNDMEPVLSFGTGGNKAIRLRLKAASVAVAAAAAAPTHNPPHDDNRKPAAVDKKKTMASPNGTQPPAHASTAHAAAAHNGADTIYLIDSDDDDLIVVENSKPPSSQTAAAPSAQQHGRAKKRQRLVEEQDATHNTPELTAEWQVLTVFPDVDVAFVRQLLAQHQQNVAAVLNEMVEMKSYPKSTAASSNTATMAGAMPIHDGGTVVVHMESLATSNKNETKNWMSSESFEPTALYIEQARHVLLTDFCFLSHVGARQCLKYCHNHYAICHEKILQAVKGPEQSASASVAAMGYDDETNVQYDRVLAITKGGRVSTPSQDACWRIMAVGGMSKDKYTVDSSKLFLKNPRSNQTKSHITDPTLIEEIKYVKAKLNDWMAAQQTTLDGARLKRQAQENGSAMECPCCCDSYPLEQMIQCQEGHLFCNACLVSYSNNVIFGSDNLGVHKTAKKLSLELQCLNGDCSSYFSRLYLAHALPERLLQKYDAVQLKLSIASAGMADTVCSCPKCDFVMDVPPEQRVLTCPVAECRYVSCRECGEASHIPLRCDEVEKANVTKGRLAVEEAISAAKIRKCPNCKNAFIKSDGCNKITCGCGTKSCYLCQKTIKDYTHFCQTPHCTHGTCNKCPLYTKTEEDDERAMREAGFSALEKVTAELNSNVARTGGGTTAVAAVGTTGGAAPQIDVESILNAK